MIDDLGPKFPIPVVMVIMRGLLEALKAAHETGLIHRDIKPANILLNHAADEIESLAQEAIKVTDFGLGRIGGVTTQSIMQSGSVLTEDGRSISGTLAYMSPDQKEGREADARADLYSCGIVLYEMLTGERPHGGDLPSLLRTEVSTQLDEVFKRCYTRLERRFASAAEMLEALQQVEGAPATPPPPPLRPKGEPGVPGVCPSCSIRVCREDQFCIKCGRQLVEAVPRCPACKAYVHRNDQFCILCGHDLRVLAD